MSLFGKLTNVLRSAAEEFSEVLAPTHRAPIEDFKYNWKRITDYVFFMDQSGEAASVEDTDIPSHLEAMVRRLEEEEVTTPAEMGPCMEHMLRFHILKTAVVLGQGNFPTGMMREILRFHTKLLASISQPLIPHVDVYGPLKSLMSTCKQRVGKQLLDDMEFVNLLCAVCGKIVDDNSLVEFFIDRTPVKASASTPVQPSPDSFILVSALLPLMFYSDETIAQRAREALMVCLIVKSRHAANVIVETTPTCKSLADQLVQLFAALPLQTEDYDQETRSKIAKWGDLTMDTWRSITIQSLAAHKETTQIFLQFMRMLQYCDEAIRLSEPVISQALSEAVLQQFLTPVVGPRISQRSEQVNVAATNILTACVTQLWSTQLQNAFVEFLLGSNDSADFQLRNLLIDRCNDMSNEVSLSTLLLFQKLVDSRNEECFVLLGFSRLASASSSTEADASEPADEGDHLSETRRLVSRLLAVVPTELKSCSSADEQFTYREYLQDAQHQVLACFEACRSWTGEGARALPADQSFVHSGDDDDHDAGVTAASGDNAGAAVENSVDPPTPLQADAAGNKFLETLLLRLRDLANQPYAMNLAVTALLSNIIQFPHESLQHFLLGPQPGSLLSMLNKISSDVQTRAGRIPNVEQRLAEARQALVDPTASLAPSLSPEQVNLLHAVIVLEEFCKELAAIVLVKANALLLEG
eukprot:m.332041 g.332041  ORF g.332041 m.332041 type:complete len:698 (+) comp19775_c3_seq1:592-2685(+)